VGGGGDMFCGASPTVSVAGWFEPGGGRKRDGSEGGSLEGNEEAGREGNT
jgi:hypothetical protein